MAENTPTFDTTSPAGVAAAVDWLLATNDDYPATVWDDDEGYARARTEDDDNNEFRDGRTEFDSGVNARITRYDPDTGRPIVEDFGSETVAPIEAQAPRFPNAGDTVRSPEVDR